MKVEVLEWLSQIAGKQTCEDKSEASGDDYFNPDDFAAGNIDDAYFNGVDDGQILMARQVLEMLDKHE